MLQVCIFLKLDFPELRDMLYLCTLRCVRARGCYVQPLQRKRLRSTPPDIAEALDCAAYVVDWLQQKPDIAVAVLTTQIAYEDDNPLGLADLYDTLPSALHGAAARGFFGAGATKWRLDATHAPALRATIQTLQQLPGQLGVTAVQLTGDSRDPKHLYELCSGLACATQLTAMIVRAEKAVNTQQPAPWLRRLAPLTGLQRLEVRGFELSGESMLDVAATLGQLLQLTALVLEGDNDHHENDETDQSALTQLLAVLHALTALSQLGLSRVTMGRAALRELQGVLAGLPQLCSLDMSRVIASYVRPDDVVMSGVVACTALTKLDLANCKLEAGCDSVRALCGMRAPLLSLTLAENYFLRTASVCKVLALPSLRGLTRLSLLGAGIRLKDDDTELWRQLCTLTALQELRLAHNYLCSAGADAFAVHVSALGQLRRLDISHCSIAAADTLADRLWKLPRLRQLSGNQNGRELFEVPDALLARGFELVDTTAFDRCSESRD